MRGKYKLVGIGVAFMAMIAMGGLMLHLMDTPAVAEDEPAKTETHTMTDEEGDTVIDTRTDEDLEAMYQAGERAHFGDDRYIDYVIERTIEDAPDHVTMYGQTFGVLENGETFGRVTSYVDENGLLSSYQPDYEPTASSFYSSDGTLVWLHNTDWFDAGWNTPGEAAYLAAHPREIQRPLYVKPGGEVYEYKTCTIGGLSIFNYEKCKYLCVTLVDGSELEFLMEDYLADPSILDQYDVLYLIPSDTPLKVVQANGMSGPARSCDYDSPNGTHLLVKLRDNSVVDILLEDYYANPDILDQYDIRDIIHTEKSLEEYEEMGVAEELFW